MPTTKEMIKLSSKLGVVEPGLEGSLATVHQVAVFNNEAIRTAESKVLLASHYSKSCWCTQGENLKCCELEYL